MTYTTLVVGLMIGIGIGAAAMAVLAEGRHVAQCDNCRTEPNKVYFVRLRSGAAPGLQAHGARIADEMIEDLLMPGSIPIREYPAPSATAAGAIDLGRLARAESGGDRHAISRAGARGLYQLMEPTFRQMAAELGRAEDWVWPQDAEDPGISRAIAHRYINGSIPKMLRAYGLPDSVIMRLAAYNWGIGNVIKAHESVGGVLGNMPEETRALIVRYTGTSRTRKRSAD